MKLLTTVLLLSAITLSAHAGPGRPTVDLPAQPSEALREQLTGVGSLVGIYLASRQGAVADMKKLQADDTALDPQLLALVAETKAGQFHFSNSGIAISLEEDKLEATRKGKPVNLENTCADWPKAGDRLFGRYQGAGWTAQLDVLVESHVPYIKDRGQLRKVNAGDSTTCASEVGAQTYYSGTVSVSFDGKVVKQGAVVVYNLQLP